MAAMTFDDAARQRQREAQAAALFVEHPAVALVCSLYTIGVADDDDRSWPTVARFTPPLGDDKARAGLFT